MSKVPVNYPPPRLPNYIVNRPDHELGSAVTFCDVDGVLYDFPSAWHNFVNMANVIPTVYDFWRPRVSDIEFENSLRAMATEGALVNVEYLYGFGEDYQVQDLLRGLLARKSNVYIITIRGGTEVETARFVTKVVPRLDSRLVVHTHDKAARMKQIVHERQFDRAFVIDDNPEILESVAQADLDCSVELYLADHPYNQDAQISAPFRRVFSDGRLMRAEVTA